MAPSWTTIVSLTTSEAGGSGERPDLDCKGCSQPRIRIIETYLMFPAINSNAFGIGDSKYVTV